MILPSESGTPAAASLLALADAHYRSGRLREADALCTGLLVADPRHAPALLLRGLIAHQQGRPADAVGHLMQAATLAPKVAAVHHGLAEAYRAIAQPADAERHYRRVAELQPGAVPFLNLGNALMELERPAAATAAYKSALRFDDRLPEIHLGIGNALAVQGRNDAVGAFTRAIALRPGFTIAYEGLIEACISAGAWDAAWEAASQALLHLDTPKLRMLFVSSVTSGIPRIDAPGLREAMQRALAERWTRPHELARAACTIVALRQPIEAKDALLGTLLELTPICHQGIEKTLIEQRRILLETAASGVPLSPEALATACALARQCFINEYAWDCAAERGLVDDLRRAIQVNLDRGVVPSDTMVVAVGMYVPLGSLNGADRLLIDQRPPHVTAVLAQQISEPIEELQLLRLIPRATSIEDDISQAVRDQYEANPYPRWVTVSGTMHRLQLDEWLVARFPNVPLESVPTGCVLETLVAGCGTGQQPIELIQQFANIKVLAIDLSLTSLAYAARMTATLGVQGIEYVQADLLQAAELGRSFDFITAAGVLHHLADLWSGWRTLLGLLRPGGVMAVSLYTMRGRSDIRRAREWIAARGYQPTPAGIQKCRKDLMALHDGWAMRVSSSPDFCSSSACRDLLFHVQEHAVTPSEVSLFLATEGISLLGLEATPASAQAFKAWSGGSDGDALRDLVRWDLFEDQHPTSFAGMLHMWLQKPRIVQEN